jgi:regulator of RNase E activity RraA
VGDDDGLLVLEESDLKAIMEEAKRSLRKEANLISQIKSGASLGDAFGIEEFFEKRRSDPEADFNAHIASRGKAI